jgi:hypothetical protein
LTYMRLVVMSHGGLYANVQRGLPPAVEREEGDEGESDGPGLKRRKRRRSRGAADDASNSVVDGCVALQQGIGDLAAAFRVDESTSQREQAQILAIAAQTLETKSRTIAQIAAQSNLSSDQLESIKRANDMILKKTLMSLDSDGE